MRRLFIYLISTYNHYLNIHGIRYTVQGYPILYSYYTFICSLGRGPRCTLSTPGTFAQIQQALTYMAGPYNTLTQAPGSHGTVYQGAAQGAAPPLPGPGLIKALYPNGHGVCGGFRGLKARKNPSITNTIFLKLFSRLNNTRKNIVELFLSGTNFCTS